MRDHYSPNYSKNLLQSLLETNTRFGLSLDELISRIVPSRPEIQKGDLAEAVSCLSFEKLFGLFVPYHKWANKSHSEMPEHGIDVFAFEFRDVPLGDTMYVTSVKWRKDTKDLLNEITRTDKGIISAFKVLNDLKLCDELNLLLKRIENDLGIIQYYERILDFLQRFMQYPSKNIYNVTFFLVDSQVDIDKCVMALYPATQLDRRFKVYNHLVENLEDVTEDIFRRIKH